MNVWQKKNLDYTGDMIGVEKHHEMIEG